MIGDKWIIYWKDYMSDAYTYGSKVSFHAIDDIEFENPMMPSGMAIKKWFSKTIFQLQRIEPNLPIIDGEATYKIKVDMEVPIEEGIFIKIVFYNKYDVEVGNVIIRNKEGIFRCPLSTYKYEVQLISAGATYFRFHSIVLQEIADEPKEQLKEDKKNTNKGKKTSRKNDAVK